MSNPWEEKGRQEKAMYIESSLRDAGCETVADLDALTPEARRRAEEVAAVRRGVRYKPASEATWAEVRRFFEETERFRSQWRKP